MQPYKLSGQRTWINRPWWIRTTITGSKDRCPAIGRRGSGRRKLVQKLHRDNARRRTRDDRSRPRRYGERRDHDTRADATRVHAADFEYGRTRPAHSVEKAKLIAPREEGVDFGPSRSHERLEIVDGVSGGRIPVGEH